MKAARWIGGIVVVAGIAAGGFAYQRYYAPPVVVIAQPARGPAVKAVYATGNVEATHWAKVTPLSRGRIEEICRCEGKRMALGDMLARLDDREMRAQLNELKARESFLGDELTRYRRLLERKVVSAQSYERIASQRAEVLSAIAAAYERLSQRVLRAPMAGVVLRRDGEVGEVVEPGQILFWVGQVRPLRITADVDEEDIPMVRTGQRALIKADAFPGRDLEGTVGQITPKGDPTNKNFRVRVLLPDDTPLLIGMTTEINIVVDRSANALLVPAGAFSNGHVWIVNGDRARRKKIEAGIRGDKYVQILSGVSESDRVIVDPPITLRDGARVRVSGDGMSQ